MGNVGSSQPLHRTTILFVEYAGEFSTFRITLNRPHQLAAVFLPELLWNIAWSSS